MENNLINPKEILDRIAKWTEWEGNTYSESDLIEAMKEYARACCGEQKKMCLENCKTYWDKDIENESILANSILNCPNVIGYEECK